MRLVTVGTGTVVPDPDRASACHWIESGATRCVVDCGAGALQGLARYRLDWDRAGHLLISHFHADHIAEIPSLLFALRHALPEERELPLSVWGPVGTRSLFDAWARAYGDWITDPGFGLTIRELRRGERVDVGGLRVGVASTRHTDESLAFRFEREGVALGYTGDTGPQPDLETFFRGVDLLLAECSLPDEIALENHLSPTSLARLASGARTERLAVTHVYPQLRSRDVPALIREAGYLGDIVMAADGTELEI